MHVEPKVNNIKLWLCSLLQQDTPPLILSLPQERSFQNIHSQTKFHQVLFFFWILPASVHILQSNNTSASKAKKQKTDTESSLTLKSMRRIFQFPLRAQLRLVQCAAPYYTTIIKFQATIVNTWPTHTWVILHLCMTHFFTQFSGKSNFTISF